jgi:type IV pilus assembly protein PilE
MPLGGAMETSGTGGRGSGPTGARGFTLMELMIAVAIAAILLSIAVPSYREYVRRGAVAAAIETLAGGRVVAEQFFLDNRTYVGMPCPDSTKSFEVVCDEPEPDATSYTITVKGTADGPIDGFVFTIDEANQRTTDGPWGQHDCWVVRKGDDC